MTQILCNFLLTWIHKTSNLEPFQQLCSIKHQSHIRNWNHSLPLLNLMHWYHLLKILTNYLTWLINLSKLLLLFEFVKETKVFLLSSFYWYIWGEDDTFNDSLESSGYKKALTQISQCLSIHLEKTSTVSYKT